jgi:DNA repair protein RadA/Sms
MIEIQSLVSTAVYGTPQRSTTGYNAETQYDFSRSGKKVGFRLGAKDVFLNITGGISVDDPYRSGRSCSHFIPMKTLL